jgi:hypothetical protein
MAWSNQQSTTLDGQEFTYTNTTIEFGAATTVTFADGGGMTATGAPVQFNNGSTVEFDETSDITVAGCSLALGIVGRAISLSDLPTFGSLATDQNNASEVISASVDMVYPGRIYHVYCPGLTARKNVVGGTGFGLTFTDDGTTPTIASNRLGNYEMFCDTAGKPFGAEFGFTYTRGGSPGPFAVLLSIWTTSGGGATTANALFGCHIELIIEDKGVDPGT